LKAFKWILICAVAAVACAAFVGCSTIDKVFEDKPPKVVIRISSDNDINPDMNGRPSPIVLRIYALKSDDIFNNADFFAIYENDASILGDTMTAREEVELAPGDGVQMEKEFDMATTHVGVLAAYRDLDNAVWRGSILTPVNETTYVDVNLGRLTLSVKPGKK